MLLASSFLFKNVPKRLNSKNQGLGLVFKPLQPNKKIEKKIRPVQILYMTYFEPWLREPRRPCEPN